MANTVTSFTGVVVGNDVTFLIPGTKESVFLYINYTKGDGTSISITMGAINPSIHATNEYLMAPFVTGAVAAITMTMNADQKRLFEVPVSRGDKKILVHIAFTGGTTQAVVADVYGN